MSITLDLKPEPEASLKETAKRAGLSLEEYLVDWIEQAHPLEVMLEAEMAKLIAEAEESHGVSDVNAPAANLEELFARRSEEETTNDPEELDRRDAALEKLKANLNVNRAAIGERLLFPLQSNGEGA